MKEELPVEQQTFEVDVTATGGDVEGVDGDTATTGNDVVTVGSEATGTESEAVAIETTPTMPDSTTITAEPTTTPVESVPTPFDLEAELNRREARAKRFGGDFDREQCKQMILNGRRTSSQVIPQPTQEKQDDSVIAARRARFGVPDQTKEQRRRERFGEPNTDESIRKARVSRFGEVDQSKLQRGNRKRMGVLSSSRKIHRFRWIVCSNKEWVTYKGRLGSPVTSQMLANTWKYFNSQSDIGKS